MDPREDFLVVAEDFEVAAGTAGGSAAGIRAVGVR